MLLTGLGAFKIGRVLSLCLAIVSIAAIEARSSELPEPKVNPHVLFEIGSGKILSQHKIDQRWAPASLTKLMTAYTVFRALELQHLGLNSPIRISEASLAQPPTKMGFPIGTILTVEAALKIILVKSANDVSVALAEGVGGSEEQFVYLMNAHARRLGMTDSQFTNPHGLHDPDQYTSARDMALLTQALRSEFAKYADFFDLPSIRVGRRLLRNHNALLRLFEGTTGLKTGYVCASGYNVIVSAERDDRKLAVVILGGRSSLRRNILAARLLTDGFASNELDSSKADDSAFRGLNGYRLRQNGGAPADITKEICPRKYAAEGKPDSRPPEAPNAQDFDGIDTRYTIEFLRERAALQAQAIIPLPRPEYQPPEPASVSQEIAAGSEEAEQAALSEAVDEEKAPSLRDLAALYLVPVTELKPTEQISLGGATGLNPFGIRHTGGGVYRAPIPVPVERPTLDLAKTQE